MSYNAEALRKLPLGVVEGEYLSSVAHGMTHLRQHFLEVGGSPLHDHVDTGRRRSPSAAATKTKREQWNVENVEQESRVTENVRQLSEGKVQKKR